MTTMDIIVPDSQRRAERKLAALLLIHADLEVDPDGLGVFIRENWSKISPLAHLIHGAERDTKGSMDNTKAPPAGANPDDGWIKWFGGACPVSADTQVWVRFRGDAPAQGSYYTTAGALRWAHMASEYSAARHADIVAYRLTKP